MNAIDRKVLEICDRIYLKGYELRMSRETAKNLVAIEDSEIRNPAAPVINLPRRIRWMAAGAPQIRTSTVKRV